MLCDKPCQKITTFLIFCLCATFVIIRTAEFFEKYFDGARSIDVSYGSQTKATFPSVTLCPNYHENASNPKEPMAYNHQVLNECKIGQHQIIWKWTSDQCHDPNVLLDKVLPTLDDFQLKSIEVETYYGNNKFLGLTDDRYLKWEEVLIPFYGKCFTMTFADELVKAEGGIAKLVIRSTGNKYYGVYIHNYGSLNIPNSSPGVSAHPMLPKTHFNLHVSLESMTYVGHDLYGICVNDLEYHEHNCLSEKIYKESMKKVNCSLPHGKFKDHICTNEKDALQAFEILRNRLWNTTDCLPPCHYVSTAISSNYLTNRDGIDSKLVFFFTKDIKHNMSSLAYGQWQLLADVGGFVGLFLGISVFDLRVVFIMAYNRIFGK